MFSISLSRFNSICIISLSGVAFILCLVFGYWWWALFFCVLNSFLLVYPFLNPYSRLYGPVVTSFRTKEKEVWLTIDDGPCEGDLELLDILERYDAKATFFVIGEQVELYPEVVCEILSRGHTLANHTMTHPQYHIWRYLPHQIAKEIDGCNSVLEKHTGRPSLLFRCPVGMKNIFVHPLLKRRQMKLLAWSARGFDGISNDVDKIMECLTKNITSGSIILLHSGREASPIILERTLRFLQKEGYMCTIPHFDAF